VHSFSRPLSPMPTSRRSKKPGEWQILQLGDHGVGANYVGTECIGDRSILAKFNAMPNCTRKETHTEGLRTNADAQCQMLDSAMTFREKIVPLGDDDFYICQHVTYAPLLDANRHPFRWRMLPLPPELAMADRFLLFAFQFLHCAKMARPRRVPPRSGSNARAVSVPIEPEGDTSRLF
jgi:hypothetical protein